MNDNNIINGDCIEELKKLPDNSVDAIITDPPYGLEFMGKEWDSFKKGERKSFVKGGGDVTEKTNDAYMRINKTANRPSALSYDEINELQRFSYNWAKECLRVLKPGAYLLSFGGTRTYHRMACGIEDAGFEIRDCIMWIYGSGFPKSLNIGKQIDKIQGNEREIVGKHQFPDGTFQRATARAGIYSEQKGQAINTKGSSEWEGWGTALKPACEPIVVARKPLSEKNVALNVLKWGTGGINIDECRIETDELTGRNNKIGSNIYGGGKGFPPIQVIGNPIGRFPANIILDEEAGRMLDEQSGIKKGNGHWSKTKTTGFGEFGNGKSEYFGVGEKDTLVGGASRFFYCAKASKSERNNGCENYEEVVDCDRNPECYSADVPFNRSSNPKKNNHPTVKPVALMEYLIKLVSRENAIVLDPFLGSGTTAIACLKTNRKFIGIEKEPEYIKIAQARIKPYLEQIKLLLPEEKQDE